MRWLLIVLCGCAVSCVVVRSLQITPIEPTDESPITVTTPVKAHLADGSTVVFAEGVTVADGRVLGRGERYDIALQTSVRVSEVALSEVAAMESFQTPVNQAATGAASTGATVGGGLGGAFMFKAIFGSCPTIYSFIDGQPVLEAESFSYAIAPSFEHRDVDRLGVGADRNHIVALEIRNEALETHYINHVELLEARHGASEMVVADPKGRPYVVGDIRAPELIKDSNGDRIETLLADADGDAWGSDPRRLERLPLGGINDRIDVEFTPPPGVATVALVLRLRNSLLNTILLYDVMLKQQGFRALDWMAADLARTLPKYRLAHWYSKRMGMRVLVERNGQYRQAGRLADTGPIAWHEVGIPIRIEPGKRNAVRLEFVVDNWRVDWIAIAGRVRQAEFRQIPVERVLSSDGMTLREARQTLMTADDGYFITKPGDRAELRFHVGPLAAGVQRTFFLAAEGYYIEWLRQEWLESSTREPFRPDDAALHQALALWEQRRGTFADEFESTRITLR